MLLSKLANLYGSTKLQPHTLHYLAIYESLFGPVRERVQKVLEIGVQNGSSLKMWRDYFPNASIYGVDIDESCMVHNGERVKVLIGDQSSPEFLNTLPAPFDIIIDDGGHYWHEQQISFDRLFRETLLYYVIEDLHTSYWKKFASDGYVPTVKFLTDLWDGMNYGSSATNRYGIDCMTFYDSMCVIKPKRSVKIL